jgi:nitrous oxidase accessory protein NosD
MKQKYVSTIVGLTVVWLLASFSVNVHFGWASRTIIVPDEYPTIDAAIRAASSGDIIRVKSGVYQENLVIDKPLSLIGENRGNTTILGTGGVERGLNAVFTLTANRVTVSGFDIESLNYSSPSKRATGFSVEGDGCTITDNNISNLYYGIFCSVQSLTLISRNSIIGNYKDGIRFCGGSQSVFSENYISGNSQSAIAIEGYSNTISKNKIENNGRGIGVGTSYSIVFGNSLISNIESGFYFTGSSNIISSNVIIGSKWGIYFSPLFSAPNGNKFYHNTFNNTYNVGGLSTYNIQTWDNGYPSGGNNWNDYISKYPEAGEVDTSGIGNKVYEVGDNNTDRYPLIDPFNNENSNELPSAIAPPAIETNAIVAHWPFDAIEPDSVTPDETGINSAVLGSTTGNVSFTPKLVDGKVGKALSFDGTAFVNVPILPNLEIPKETTIDVWINVQSLKNVAYNNIVIEAVRSRAALPERTFGLAVNGQELNADKAVLKGALRAYVFTENEGFNEIVTTEPIVSLNQWIHVVFTRSLATGMQIYVNGEEKDVTVTSGVLNPQGPARRETELYIGHDAVCFIDELSISNFSNAPTNQEILPMQILLLAALTIAISGIGLLLYVSKSRH